MISHVDMKSEWENSTNNDGCMLQGLDAKNYTPQSVVEIFAKMMFMHATSLVFRSLSLYFCFFFSLSTVRGKYV